MFYRTFVAIADFKFNSAWVTDSCIVVGAFQIPHHTLEANSCLLHAEA